MMMSLLASNELSYTLKLDFNLDQTARPQIQPGDFRWDGDWLVRVGVARCDCSWFTVLQPEVAHSLRDHLIKFSRELKYAPATLMNAVDTLCVSISKSKPQVFNKTWLLNALSSNKFRRQKGVLKSFFLYWHDRFPSGISSEVLLLLAKQRGPSKNARNVLSDDPEESWLTEFEFDALLQRVWQNYDQGISGSQITLLRLLSMQYARRPVQLTSLKIGDFRNDRTGDIEMSGQRVHFPGAKDRNAHGNFRDSKVEIHPLPDHLWQLFLIQKHGVRKLCEDVLQFSLDEEQLDQMPVFIDRLQLDIAIHELTNHYRVDWRLNLDHRVFHMPPGKVSKYVAWTSKEPSYTWETDDQQSFPTPPDSHRTGQPIRVTATRLRHTRARQLARLGMPKHVLSFWLGHSSEKSIDAYYNDPAEEARKINEVMGGALAPLAMSFTGKLLDNESQASRADDPESTLEFPSGKDLRTVGNCGKHSFCATTTVPVPCYRCKHFEPLVFAPHGEVLDALLLRQSEENAMIKIGGNRKLLTPIDLTPDIRAVQACIDRCNLRKAELEGGE